MFKPEALLVGLAIFTIVTNLPGLLSPKNYRKALKSYLDDKNQIRSMGIIMLILSFFFLATKWDFTYEWETLISVLGWTIFIKSLIWLWSPDFVKSHHKNLRTSSDALTITTSIVAILVAIFLVYIAAYLI